MTCPACSNDEFRHEVLLPALSVGTCSRCGLRISDLQARGRGTSEFARVDAHAYEASVGRVRRQQALDAIALVKEHRPAARTWLDVGCSFGYLLGEAQRLGYEVTGVEPDQQAFEHASQLVGAERVHRGLLTDAVVEDGTADVVSTMDVLEHVPVDELGGFAATIRRKLRPSGSWLIKVPSSEGLYFVLSHRLVRLARPLVAGVIQRLWQTEYEFPHTVYFDLRSLREFLESHGFELVAHRYLQEVPNNTVKDRLLLDSSIPRWQAYPMCLGLYLVNLVERIRRRTDALLVLARPSG